MGMRRMRRILYVSGADPALKETLMDEDEIRKRKLASNLRKAHARREKANQAVSDAKAHPNASSKSGKAAIRRQQKAARKASENYNRAEHDVLKDETGAARARPRRPRRL